MKTFEIGEVVRPVGEDLARVVDYDSNTGAYLVQSLNDPSVGWAWEDWFSPYELEKYS